MLLIVVVVIDYGVSTRVNTTILLIYIINIYNVYFLFVKKSLKIPGDDDVSPISLKPISQSAH